MAKKKKKKAGPRPMPKEAVPPAAKINWKLVGILAALAALTVLGIVLAVTLKGCNSETPPIDNPGITSPSVDTSDLTTMRVVKPGSAYITPDQNSSTVFSFRKGDLVDVVSSEGGWTTIAVEGRGYYVPSETLRAVDEYLIVIDAGHQLREDRLKEAIGPGGAESEIRMDIGHTGVATGQKEYDLTLAVSLELQKVLEQRGYKVVMIRNHNAVNVSYKERTEVANKLYADAYISLHAGKDNDAAVRGMSAICQSVKNPYNADLYAQSKELSKQILDATVEVTGAKKLDMWETDTNAGINWCQVPVSFVEVGQLSNADEDRLMTTEAYRQKIAEGIANGLDAFFADDE